VSTNTAITTASAAGILAAHGVPEDVICQALDAHARQLAAFQRRAHDKQVPRFHMGLPCQPGYRCGVSAVINLIDPDAKEGD
jgi:hypothetical protein